MRFPALIAVTFLCTASLVQAQVQQRSLPGRVADIKVGEFFINAPDSIAAGVVTFRVTQTGDATKPFPADMAKLRADVTYHLHMVWLVRLDSAKTISDLFKAEQDRLPTPWATLIGGAGAADVPGSSNVSMIVAPGNYALVCYVGSAREDRNRYHLLKGMLRPLKVVGMTGDVRLPATDLTVVLRADSVVMPDTIAAGAYRVLVRNERPRRADLGIGKLKPTFTLQQAREWRPMQLTEPPRRAIGGVVSIATQQSLMTTVVLDRGDYFFGQKHVVVR